MSDRGADVFIEAFERALCLHQNFPVASLISDALTFIHAY